MRDRTTPARSGSTDTVLSQLKPRSVSISSELEVGHAPPSPRSARRERRKSLSARGDPFAPCKNPFGEARPREVVLASRGIDPALFDRRIERKSRMHHFTHEEEEELSRVQMELEAVEREWAHAEAAELPAERWRQQTEEKRKELEDLTTSFCKASLDDQSRLDNSASSLQHRPRKSEPRET